MGNVQEETTALDCENIQENVEEIQKEKVQTNKKKLPKWLDKIITYLKEHEDIRQMVFFTLFSFICGGTQGLITLFLPMILRAINPAEMSTSFSWFIFDYTNKGLGEFIGFLVGSFIGQILTFVLNRKKTFNISDHIPFRAICYTIMAILIILMQTALGGAVTTACGDAVTGTDLASNDLLSAVFNLTGQAVAGIAALIVNFLGNKFFVMRKFKSSAK